MHMQRVQHAAFSGNSISRDFFLPCLTKAIFCQFCITRDINFILRYHLLSLKMAYVSQRLTEIKAESASHIVLTALITVLGQNQTIECINADFVDYN